MKAVRVVARAAIAAVVAYALWRDTRAAAHAGVVALGGFAVLAACPAVLARVGVVPDARRRERRRRAPHEEIPAVAADRRLVLFAERSSWDVHTRLRPRLRELAADLLADRRGLHLDDPGDAPAVRELVGEPAWDLLRHDRPPPDRREGGGLDPAELDAVLAGLERI